MNAKRWIASIVNLCIFTIAGLALYDLGNRRNVMGIPKGGEAPSNVPTEVPVRVGTIQQTTLRQLLTAYGWVEPAPASTTRPAAEAHLTAPAAALISEVDCVEGEHVDKGQTLFALDPRAADAVIAADKQLVAGSQSLLQSVTGSARPSDVPGWIQYFAQWQLNSAQSELARATSQRDLLTVTAPISGTITALQIHPGEIADPAAQAVELVDTDRLVLALDIPGFAVPNVRIGQSVIINPAGIWGDVIFIDPAINPATGMASVDVSLPPRSDLKAGQFTGAQIVLDERACLAVPAQSIVHDSLGRAQLAVVDPDERQATMQIVQTGIRDGDQIEVNGPSLQAGQEIVVGGAYGLLSRTGITVVAR
jgi:membrane fusion protein, multidrug efflux system